MSRWCNRRLVSSTYHYALCIRERDYFAEMRKQKILAERDYPRFLDTDHADATTQLFERKNRDGRVTAHVAIVCLRWPSGKTGVETAALLVHEAVHIWQRICLDIGEHEPSKEFEAYSIQSISQELMEQFVRQTKGRR